MDPRLYEACRTGNLAALRDLINQDMSILHEVVRGTGDTPLHVAARFGDPILAREVLQHRPDMAHAINLQGLSPMHLAVANRHLDAYRVLLDADHSNLCFLRDRDGRTPLHYAAMNGDFIALSLILSRSPRSAETLTDRGETVLLLCAKYHRFETLRDILRTPAFRNLTDLINQPDNNGNTVKKLVNVARRPELAEYLQQQDEDEKKHWIDFLKISRNATSVVAGLIATAAFNAGLSPPSRDKSDGQAAIVASRVHTAAFKVFVIANAMALMLSLSILVIDIVIVPFVPASFLELAKWTRRILWGSLAMLLVAFMSATRVVIPHTGAHSWLVWYIWSLGVLTVLLLLVLVCVMKIFYSGALPQENGARIPEENRDRIAQENGARIPEENRARIPPRPWAVVADVNVR
ncbi:ankyrin repeat-containing protein ITN1 [Amborella trichopoda]|uniref:PGG domain-containing protein n=1 Tax=Amborella trichopoda TaxID=13333 RepID=U5CPH8_AMBTC|nr:ankyrin repeat-containing protein ITN1 [Amborella trichopoda]ERN15056.1 hypothetical protein AMTR_s00056p00021960 [Amborella trichopoda]|eukprot:XP_006853589.1 ankyrin repeat-containing protein ITN1 [Amborella trichopoda]